MGRWRSVDPMALHRNARLIGAYYRDRLARNLIARGYSIVPAMAGRVPSFDIAGFGRELREAFSTRRREVLAYVEDRGWDGSEAQRQIATLATRGRKAEPLQGMLRTLWRERAGSRSASEGFRSRVPGKGYRCRRRRRRLRSWVAR